MLMLLIELYVHMLLNLLNIYSALSCQTMSATLEQFSGKGFSFFKPMLIEIAVETLNPISSEIPTISLP